MDKYKLCAAALSAALLVALPGCTLGTPTPTPTPTPTVAPTPNPYEEEAEAFVETFAQDHPGYELLDYAVGSPDTATIHAAVIAKDTKSGSSSTLFLLGDNGATQQLELAQDSYTVYREEDGITLKGNVVHLSLDLSIPAAASLWEIHDYAITVTQDENGIQNTNQDTIRSE